MATNVPDEPSNVPGEPGNVLCEPSNVPDEPEAKAEEPMEVATGESVVESKGGKLPQESEGPSTSASLEGEASVSLQSKIEAQRNKLKEIVEYRFGLLSMLRTSRTLNRTDQEEIEAKPTTRSKNERLLEIIFEKGKYQEFIDALQKSDQTHVVNWINRNGVYKDEFDLDWPLSEREAEILENNYHQLSDLLEVTGEFIGELFSMHVLNKLQKEFFSSRNDSFKASQDFLDMLSQSSLKNYFLVAQCLRKLNAGHIADILENVTFVVPIHANVVGDNVPVDEVEKRLVDKVMKVLCLEDKESFEKTTAASFIARLNLRIIAAKQGNSIVLYVSCCSVGEFRHLCSVVDNDDMKDVLEKLFNYLLQNLQTKVLLVAITESDRENADRLFQREFLRDKKYDEHFERLRLQLKYEERMEVTTAESVEEGEEEELQQKSKQHATISSEEVSPRSEETMEFGGKGAQAVADEDTIPAILRNNFEFFKENILPKKLIPKLSSLEILTDNNKRFISTLKSESDKNHEILNIIRGSSVKNYYEFIHCLRETGQGLVANVAEKGGVTVRMKITHEPMENIAEIENEIIAKLNQLHESASPRSEDLWRLLSQLKIGGMEILSARYDEGVVTWIWCRSSNAITKLEKLSKDKRLGNLFSALFRCLQIPTVPKINDVLWENPDVDFVNRKLCKWGNKASATMAGLKISGIAMMGNKIITVFQNRSALLVFSCDEEGNTFPEKEEPLKKIDTPMHMAASLNLRCLYITDRTSNDIYKVNVDPEGKVDEPKLWLPGSSAEQNQQINSLSVGRDDNLLVLKESKPNRLEIYNKDAKKVEVLEFPDQIRYPNNVAEASNGDFVISYRSDLTPGGICRITRSGEWVSRLDLGFKSRPIQGLSKEEKSAVSSLSDGIPYLKHLDHFTLDDEDQVYACDADQYVVLLDSQLNMEEAIEVKDLKNPYRIHYLKDKKELLLVHGTDQDSFSLLCSK